ncbi:multiple sugar transport system permease protein [Curtobacterium pusillum]|uniref:Multiple sugar transport system permease protein n=1 Tax=Curtobacterium pusillum TaxID=69373 RepID=A0AAW3T4W1_9MICO|nr:sugar ABC transporter permease [Curtobacterium pusillum]MBA8989472.1 multiple sugar transport system permease protein [Curtobacterium pusillum]
MTTTSSPAPATARAATPPVRRRASFSRWRSRGGPAAVVLALPAFLVFLYFAWGPIVRAVVMSFEKTNLVGPSIWVGLGNFTYVLADPLLPRAIVNTLWYAFLAFVFGFPLPILLAVFIAEVRKRSWVFSALAYLPVVVPPVVSILLWKTFYDPGSSGTFNTVLGWFGVGPWPWLNSVHSAVPSIVLETTWASAGTAVIIYLAALAGVRTELYEAAELDGSGIWSRIWHITLPQMRGVILIMLLLQIIGTMQIFTEPYIFTGGGPQNSTLTVLLMIYDYAFVNSDYGAATALSVLLAVVLALFSFAYQWLTRKWGTD